MFKVHIKFALLSKNLGILYGQALLNTKINLNSGEFSQRTKTFLKITMKITRIKKIISMKMNMITSMTVT